MKLFIYAIVSLFSISLVVGDSYFITLKDDETFEDFYANDLKYPKSLQVKDFVTSTFSIGKFKGMIGDFSHLILERLSRCPYVSEMSPDIKIKALEVVEQDEAPRHLSRISQRKKLKKPPFKYIYDTDANGHNVNAYILDSGIDLGHPEFQGRAKHGKDFTNEGLGDSNGHGTHVAGIIGSQTFGVAKSVNLIEVKALAGDGSGSLSSIIAALEYSLNHKQKANVPGVANLSLGAAKNSILNKAIDAAVLSGLTVVVAAGNSNINSCKTSPGSSSKAITVGSIDDRYDTIASFSNWGECVDIFASGVKVQSVNYKDVKTSRELTGTSMSAPIVSGIIANILSSGVPSHKVKEVLMEMATDNKIKRTSFLIRKKSPNRIAFNGLDIDSDSDTEESESEED